MLHVLDLLATELLKKTAGRYADLLVWYSRFFFLLPVGTDRAYDLHVSLRLSFHYCPAIMFSL